MPAANGDFSRPFNVEDQRKEVPVDKHFVRLARDEWRGAVNPLDSFAMLKRLVLDAQPLQEVLSSNLLTINESVSSKSQSKAFPK